MPKTLGILFLDSRYLISVLQADKFDKTDE